MAQTVLPFDIEKNSIAFQADEYPNQTITINSSFGINQNVPMNMKESLLNFSAPLLALSIKPVKHNLDKKSTNYHFAKHRYDDLNEKVQKDISKKLGTLILEDENSFPFILSGIIWLKDYFKKNDYDSYIVDLIHPHKIEFYNVNKEYLNIIKGKFNGKNKNLDSYNGILSTFSKHPDQLKFQEELYQVGSEKSILTKGVLKFIDKSNKSYVVKRYFFQIQKWDSDKTKETLESVISKKYREYTLMKFFNVCPYSVEPIEIQFLYIENYSMFTTEILMEYGGKALKSLIDEGNSKLFTEENIFVIFSQLIIALNYLESYKIRHNDIKPENIVIEFQCSIPKTKLIDFNIGVNDSTTITDLESNAFYGMSELYASPELHLRTKNENVVYNPYLSQMFSFGITVLYMLNFFSSGIVSLGKFKNLHNNYSIKNMNEINVYLEQFAKLISTKPLLSKIYEVCKMCISFDRNERITANKLLFILDNFHNCTIGELILELQIPKIKNNKKAFYPKEGKLPREENDYPKDSLPKNEEDQEIVRNITETKNLNLIEEENKTLDYERKRMANETEENGDGKTNTIINDGNKFISGLHSKDGISVFTGTKLESEEGWKAIGYLTFTGNNNFYIGEVNKELQFESFGELTEGKGSTYYGQFSNGKMHGLGIMQRKSNNIEEIYFGFWNNGYRKGEGYCIYQNLTLMNTETYFGSWNLNKKNGVGTMTFSDKSTYQGVWEDDKMNGEGTMKYLNGEIYKGSWVNNQKHGSGLKYKEKAIDKYVVEYDKGNEILAKD